MHCDVAVSILISEMFGRVRFRIIRGATGLGTEDRARPGDKQKYNSKWETGRFETDGWTNDYGDSGHKNWRLVFTR